jgi:putative transposase
MRLISGSDLSQTGLAGVSRRKFVVTTVKSDSRQAPDLVERDFTASVPDRLWVADITFGQLPGKIS